ncbi:MAG: hypothetical protein AB1679_20435 [Actinomycetota bacterium]
MQASCPRCGAGLTDDAAECPVCAYGDVEEIVLLEAQRPGFPPPPPAGSSLMARVLTALAFLVVVIVVIFAAVR